MAAESSAPGLNGSSNPTLLSPSPAALLQQQHATHEVHPVSFEEVVDQEDIEHPPPSMTVKKEPVTSPTPVPAVVEPSDAPAPAPKPSVKRAPVLDIRSEELFPALGAGPKPRSVPMAWGGRSSPAGATNGGRPGSHISSTDSTRTSTPLSGAGTPIPFAYEGPKVMTLPGKHVERIRFAPSQMLPPSQLKKPIRDILRDTSKRSKAVVDIHNGPGGSIIFEGKGSVDAVRQALKEVAQQVGSKQSVRVPVPASSRAHIIGRQGAVVQGIHERTGARITIPKPDESTAAGEEDDDITIDVLIEGDAVAAEMARREIESIVKDRSSNINLRLKTIPPELFPFLAGAHNAHVNELEERTKAQIRVPRYDTWSKQPPPQEAALGQIKFVPDPERHVFISGERTAAQEARAEIERRAQDLQRQITLRQLAINRGQHQFILGDSPDAAYDFLQQTGCSIILPPPHDDTEFLTIIGPPEQIEFGINRAMDLATSMQMASIDLSRQHPTAPAGPHVHAQALTSYLQQRQVIRRLERLYDAHIVLPSSVDGPVTWEVYSRDGKNTIRARSDIMNVIQAYPPPRIASVPVDPCFHPYLCSHSAPQLKQDFGVHLVVPERPSASHVVLVYEGSDDEERLNAENEPPRRRPSADELATFDRALDAARERLLSLLGDQQNVVAKSVPVQTKHAEKVRKFVDREQQAKGEDYIPVRVQTANQHVDLRGRSNDVEELVSKITAFIVQQEQDDKERGYTTSFTFPQKFASHLIGKKGENINKLRDEFDVDLKVDNGKVEVKGPKAKAEAAKTRILAMAKRLEDETTYVLKVAPQYHKELIGQRGSQVNRLQDRYGVRVQFPRAAGTPVADDQSVADTASEIGGGRNGRATQASDEIIVRGSKKGADSARDEILSLYQWITEHSHSAFVSVAQSQVPSLIGQRGREMDKLRAETGAQIDVPGANDAPDAAGRVQIKIKGTKKQVEDAKKLLLQRAKEFDETVVKTINIDKKHHKALIGGGGANIRKIVAEASGADDSSAARTVRFPRSESDDTAIRLEGKGDVVDKIIAAIESFVEEKDNQVVVTIDIPQPQHRLLIGRGGETRRNLESQFNVNLDVPKQGSNRTDIKIKGATSAVEAAKEHIQSIIKEQHGVTVLVPRNLHHTVSDNGGFFRRLRNDHKVTVDHAGHQIPPRPTQSDTRNGADGATSLPLITDDPSASLDTHVWKIVDLQPQASPDSDLSATIPWVLTGNEDNVNKAKALVEKAMATASQESATGYLILPDPKTYRFVIGPGGSKINEIRKQTGCRINVPKHQARGEAIEIKGPSNALDAAKDMILDAVRLGGNGNNDNRG
ncbi:hypothetical protein AJ80_09096 [Polytolypa hystricis UAMH7299]|uniref:K Homology domain-containing protein n=1 Tax=Polytolypa hystricis (strain UAMH7299) TaxID=1447883 RepID=A0A2B7WNI1_POLH7|nr:hypothetical protein AJ80_09096 [Polytolypa hystricis UAMH7299]